MTRTSPTISTAISPPLLVFIGPSGAGKSSVVRRLADRGVVTVHPTWTSRPRRRDERVGSIEHHFVSEAEFARRRAEGFFLHSVSMFGLPHWYGLPPIDWSDDGTVDAVMLRAPLVPILRAVYPDLVIYQIDAPRDVVESRLATRGCVQAERDARLLDNERELVEGRRVAHRHFDNHGSLDVVIDAVAQAIRSDFAPALMEAR
jgi:ribose 1,5-bisphosphokinase PhnN